MPATRLKNELGVLTQLMSVQSIVNDIPGAEKKSEFVCQALKNIPGTEKCLIYLLDQDMLIGDHIESIAELLQNYKRYAGLQNTLAESPLRNEDILLQELISTEKNYGLLCLKMSTESPGFFKKIKPALFNFINSFVLNLENEYQLNSLKEYRNNLQSLIDERTESLTNEIRERKRALRELKKNEKFVRTLLDTSADIIYVYDLLENNFIYSNTGIFRLLGYRPEEIGEFRPSPIKHLLHPDDMQKYQQAFDDLRMSKNDAGIVENEYRLMKKNGRWLHVQSRESVFAWDGDGKVRQIFASIRDITHQKEAAFQKRAFEKKVNELKKMESLAILAGGIAHDFNNILTGILGSAELLGRRLPANDPMQRYVANMEKGIQRAADLARKMLAYSGKGHFRMSLVELNQFLESILTELRSLGSDNISINVKYASEALHINADKGQLSLALIYLINNSLEAIANGPGRIDLSIAEKVVDPERYESTIYFEDLKPGKYALINIEDNGCGMDKDTLERIFDPFFTTKFTGRGLGIPAVLGIIRGHKGFIDISSTPGKGSSITLFFPLQEES